MKPISPAPDVDRDRAATGNADAKTPNTDMQAEDAGSSDSSGADAPDESADDSATAATRAMKQTSKTAAESSGKR